jgi:hypothetical protein
MLSVSYRNISPALSRLNKVHNSIYSKKYARVNFVNLNRIQTRKVVEEVFYICLVSDCPKLAQFG